MKIINLDTEFQPFGKGIEYDKFVFPGGEPHIRIHSGELKQGEEVLITCRVRKFEDFALVLLANDALQRMWCKTSLFIPYLPGARQDRVANLGEPLTIKVYCDLINGCHFKQVWVLDPHSDVSRALIQNIREIPVLPFLEKVLETNEIDAIVAPDAGAVKRNYALAQAFNLPLIQCSKIRNTLNGEITEYTVGEGVEGKNLLICDDICDGGFTFLKLAESLSEKSVASLHLFVSHGIFSKGFKELLQHFDSLFTTSSFADFENAKLTQIPFTLIEKQIKKTIEHENY